MLTSIHVQMDKQIDNFDMQVRFFCSWM